MTYENLPPQERYVRLIEDWLAQVESDIEEYRQEIARFGDLDDLHRSELDRSKALRELLRSGLHPGRRRQFRARVLVQVRCQPKGHDLAKVYQTARWPVFVPTTGTLPPRISTGEESLERQQNLRIMKRLFDMPGLEPQSEWIQEVEPQRRSSEEEANGTRTFIQIRGDGRKECPAKTGARRAPG